MPVEGRGGPSGSDLRVPTSSGVYPALSAKFSSVQTPERST
jgi:hypothetical protein